MIEYLVSPRKLASHLAAHLREQGYEASSRATHVWAAHPNAADPSEERLILGGVIASWRGDNPDARVAPADYEPPPDKSSRAP